MNHRAWLVELVGELRRQGIGEELAGQVVAEAETHLWASGEEPMRVFGPADRYAVAVAESVRITDPRRLLLSAPYFAEPTPSTFKTASATNACEPSA